MVCSMLCITIDLVLREEDADTEDCTFLIVGSMLWPMTLGLWLLIYGSSVPIANVINKLRSKYKT